MHSLQRIWLHFGLTQLFWSDERAFQRGPVELSLDQNRTAQVRPRQIGTDEIGMAEIRLAQIRLAQVGCGEIGSAQIGPDQPGFAQVRIVEISFAQVGSAQVGLGEVDFTQVSFTQVHSAQLDHCVGMFFSPRVPERGTLLLEQVHLLHIGHLDCPPFLIADRAPALTRHASVRLRASSSFCNRLPLVLSLLIKIRRKRNATVMEA